jgi:hypothetical protein
MHKFKQGNKIDGASNNYSCSVESPRQSTISSVKEEPKGSLSTLPMQQPSEEISISETNKVYIFLSSSF